MSFYTDARESDLLTIIAIVKASRTPIDMLNRFIAVNTRPDVVGVLTDLRNDLVGYPTGGECTAYGNIAQATESLQIIADRPIANIEVLSDRDGVTLTVQEGVDILE